MGDLIIIEEDVGEASWVLGRLTNIAEKLI